jgi:ubiquinone/menaquinone biosynthesis C-methylase UbiE
MRSDLVDPVEFDGWGESFSDIAPRYEELAFSTGATDVLGERELQAVRDALEVSTCGLVLDIGAGSGRVTRSLLAAGGHVVAIDASGEMLRELARASAGVPCTMARFGEPLPFESESFDAVVALRVLKYVEDPQRALDEVARVLRPSGRAVIEWTNGRSLARLGYRGAPIRFLDRTTLARVGRRAGLRVVGTAPGSRLPHPLWRAARGRGSRATLLRVEAGLAALASALPGPGGARSVITTFSKD